MSGIFVQPPAPGFSDLKPGEGAAYLQKGTVPAGAAAPQEGLPVGGGALGGVASSVAPESPYVDSPAQGLAQSAPQQPQYSARPSQPQGFGVSPGGGPISQQILAPSQRGTRSSAVATRSGEGAFFDQAGVNRNPDEVWDQTRGLLRQGRGTTTRRVTSSRRLGTRAQLARTNSGCVRCTIARRLPRPGRSRLKT